MADETLPREALLLKCLKMTTSDNDNQALVAIRKANDILASAGWDWDKLIEGKIKVVENPFSKISDPFGGFAQTRDRAPPVPPGATTGRWSSGGPSAPPRPNPPQPKPAGPKYPRPNYATQPDGGFHTWNQNTGVWELTTLGAKAAYDAYVAARMNQQKAARQDTPAAQGKKEISTRMNNYSNHCWFCGTHVASGDGFIFKPSDFNPSAPTKWATTCEPCNDKPTVLNAPVPTKPAARHFGDVNAPKASINNL